MEEEEEVIVKGDDVIVELEATLEDLYMGGTLKVLLFLFSFLRTVIICHYWWRQDFDCTASNTSSMEPSVFPVTN